MGEKNTVDIVVYRITGRQGVIDIPHRYCEECDLTVAVARKAVDAVDDSAVNLTVKPWMLYFWKPLIRGGWHAPVLTINGKVFSQGVVPQRDALSAAIRKELGQAESESELARNVT